MAKRQRDWAKRVRITLIEQLGGKCVDCAGVKELELDHIKPCDWAEQRKRMDQSMRMTIYRREAKQGKLTVRCRSCNASKSDGNGSQARMPGIVNGKDHPF